MKFVHVHHSIIQPEWKVLQVGGGHQPFRRANYVIDNKPWSERRSVHSWLQNMPESFTEATWVAQDLENTPWPFEDEEFDYVIVDDALVATRDPIAVLKEIERVGKRGYIEVPSVYTHHLRGVEEEKYTGHTGYRWLTFVDNNELKFVYKHPSIHVKEDFWIKNPNISAAPYLAPKFSVVGLFWEESIVGAEDVDTAEFPDWFYEENIWSYKTHTDTPEKLQAFWKINDFVPVLLTDQPFRSGMLVDITTLQPYFSISMVTEQNQRHEDMLKYEYLIAANLLDKIPRS